MPSITIDDLIEVGRRRLRTSLDPGGTGAVDLAAGSDNDTLLSVCGSMAMRTVQRVDELAAARWRRSSTDTDLNLVGGDVYFSPRKVGAKSSGTVYLSRSVTTATSIPIGSRFAVPAGDGQPAVYVEAVGTVSTSSQKVAIPVQAVAAGIAGNVLLSAITQIVDTLPDTTWSLYVPVFGDPLYPVDTDRLAGGEDDETDALYQERLAAGQEKPGPLATVQAGLLAVPGVHYVDLVEPNNGSIVCYVGDTNYRLSTALRRSVYGALASYRGGGVSGIVRAYDRSTVDITATIHMWQAASSYDSSAIVTQARALVTEYFTSRFRQRDEYFLDRIRAAAGQAHEDVQTVVLTIPTADVKRLASADYGSAATMTVYVVEDASMGFTVSDPLTV